MKALLVKAVCELINNKLKVIADAIASEQNNDIDASINCALNDAWVFNGSMLVRDNELSRGTVNPSGWGAANFNQQAQQQYANWINTPLVSKIAMENLIEIIRKRNYHTRDSYARDNVVVYPEGLHTGFAIVPWGAIAHKFDLVGFIKAYGLTIEDISNSGHYMAYPAVMIFNHRIVKPEERIMIPAKTVSVDIIRVTLRNMADSIEHPKTEDDAKHLLNTMIHFVMATPFPKDYFLKIAEEFGIKRAGAKPSEEEEIIWDGKTFRTIQQLDL